MRTMPRRKQPRRKSGRACAHRAAIARANACTRPDLFRQIPEKSETFLSSHDVLAVHLRIGFLIPQPPDVAIRSAGSFISRSSCSRATGWLPAIPTKTTLPQTFKTPHHVYGILGDSVAPHCPVLSD